MTPRSTGGSIIKWAIFPAQFSLYCPAGSSSATSPTEVCLDIIPLVFVFKKIELRLSFFFRSLLLLLLAHPVARGNLLHAHPRHQLFKTDWFPIRCVTDGMRCGLVYYFVQHFLMLRNINVWRSGSSARGGHSPGLSGWWRRPSWWPCPPRRPSLPSRTRPGRTRAPWTCSTASNSWAPAGRSRRRPMQTTWMNISCRLRTNEDIIA